MNGNDKLFRRGEGLLIQEGRRRVHSDAYPPYPGWSPETISLGPKHLRRSALGPAISYWGAPYMRGDATGSIHFGLSSEGLFTIGLTGCAVISSAG